MDDEQNSAKPPAVTEEEKRLIEEAIKQGRVTKVPQGASTILYKDPPTLMEIMRIMRINRARGRRLRAAKRKHGT